MSKYELLKTYTFQLYNIGFDSLPKTHYNQYLSLVVLSHILLNCRIASKFNLIHEKGCKHFDFKGGNNPEFSLMKKHLQTEDYHLHQAI